MCPGCDHYLCAWKWFVCLCHVFFFAFIFIFTFPSYFVAIQFYYGDGVSWANVSLFICRVRYYVLFAFFMCIAYTLHTVLFIFSFSLSFFQRLLIILLDNSGKFHCAQRDSNEKDRFEEEKKTSSFICYFEPAFLIQMYISSVFRPRTKQKEEKKTTKMKEEKR